METSQNQQLSFHPLLDPRVLLAWLYHDEIKPEVGVLPITGHGSLIVPDDYRREMYLDLQMLREGHTGRIPSTRVERNRGPQYEVTARWIDAFFTRFIERVSFKATFAFHDGPIPLPYPGDASYDHHWIMSTKSNLVGHVRWVLNDLDLLALVPVFDDTGTRERQYLELGTQHARFEINERRRKGRPGYPSTFIQSPVIFQTSDHRKAADLDQAIHAEFLQLTDVLTGAAADALRFRPGAGKDGKLLLAARVTDEIARRYGHSPFRFQQHLRHFSVSLYPDARGRMYAANPGVSLRREEGKQGALFVLA